MNFADFVVDVQEEANDTSARLKGLIERWVNDAHHRICAMRDWDFLIVQKSDDTSIAAAAMPFDFTTLKVATITTPAQRILAVCDITDGNEYPLSFTTLSELRNNFPSFPTFSGKPEYWHYENQRTTGKEAFNVWPKLDQTRIFVFEFVKATKTYATGAAEALLIPDKWIHVLMHKVMERVWKYKTDERWRLEAEEYVKAEKAMIAGCTAKVKIQYKSQGLHASQLPKLSADS